MENGVGEGVYRSEEVLIERGLDGQSSEKLR
jgi:hypothetical protein